MVLEPISPELVLVDPQLRHLDDRETTMIDTPTNGGAEAKPSIETLLFSSGLVGADDLGELVRDAVVAQRPIAALAVERNLVTVQSLQTLLAQSNVEISLHDLGLANGAPAPVAPAPVPEPAPAPAPVAPAPAPGFLPPVTGEAPAAPAAPPVQVVEPVVLEPVAVEPVPVEPVPVEPVPVEPMAVEPAVVAPAPVEPVAIEPVELTASPAPIDEPAAPLAAAPEALADGYEIVVRLAGGEGIVAATAPSLREAEELVRETAHRFAAANEWPFVGTRCIRPEAVVSVDIVRAVRA